jgi:DNA-binding response OmpR family regulator
VVLAHDVSVAKTIHGASVAAQAIYVEHVGTIGSALRVIGRLSATALVGQFDFASPDMRNLIATLRNPTRTPAPHIVMVAVTPSLSRQQVVSIIRMGVDQVVVPPHTVERISSRIAAAWRSPVPNVATPTYVGPCRRRAPDDVYDGPRRRSQEQEKASDLIEF